MGERQKAGCQFVSVCGADGVVDWMRLPGGRGCGGKAKAGGGGIGAGFVRAGQRASQVRRPPLCAVNPSYPFTLRISSKSLQSSNRDVFSNIEVTNAKLISEGDNNLVVGVAFPGLNESLKVELSASQSHPTALPCHLTIPRFRPLAVRFRPLAPTTRPAAPPCRNCWISPGR